MSKFLEVLLAGFFGGLFALLGQWVILRKQRKASATYAAIRAVIALDRYIKGCAVSLSNSDKDPLWPEDRDPDENFTLPNKCVIPEDVDWTSLPADLSYKILSIPQRDEEARAAISYIWGVADGLAARTTRDERFLPIVLDAIVAARRLRKNYKLAKPETSEWDPVAILNELGKTKAEV